MASLQEQIDDLRARVVVLQGQLAYRALNSAMQTINLEINEDIDTLLTKYDDLLNCVKELQDELLAARQDLINLDS